MTADDIAAQLDDLLGDLSLIGAQKRIRRDVRRDQYPPIDLAAERKKAVAALARRNFAFFVKQAWHVLEPGVELIWNWHLQCIADDAQAMVAELARAKADPSYEMLWQNYIANIPPRSGKSRFFSVFLPAWVWLRHPEWSIRALSANPDVARRDSRDCRELIGSAWYRDTFRPYWEISRGEDGIDKFANTARGYRACSGWRAKITGTGTDIILVDDPHDAVEADSDAHRSFATDKWDVSIRSRTQQAHAHLKLGIMQRLHELDWSGHVLSRERWVHRVIPMEYETKPPCRCRSCTGDLAPFRADWHDPRTVDGELMHPERFPAAWVAEEKVALGSYGWAGQHQQRPAPADGGRFKYSWWRFWKPDGTAPANAGERPEKCAQGSIAVAIPSRFEQLVISIDAAFKGGSKNDRVAMYVIGRVGARRYVLDRRVDRMDFGATKKALRELHTDYPRATIIVEDAANGAAIISDLMAEIPGMISIRPEGGKESRAAVLSPQVEAGNWYLRDGASWLDDLTTELATFPNGAHDDQVDALSQAAVYFLGSVDAARVRMLGTR